ncbi:MAG TPA: SHOCT domain-containing protein [Hydrogenophaga sp.]|uniref:SHOCT domain-containing protein n=1 Tax=Hydrogenophaga sp. TaxID=1904254 RepID=UPI002B6F3FD8|nr:SHOCT domain-containing protein [Hydrogenophaga sp.]HMN94063.1 SHOCT domain-containing protein [Hydrogenophaga sp.]HMP09877.1 SHOCT domain-containing protein [Hydrogenophaga sp.]
MYFDHGYFMGGMHAIWWVFWLVVVVAFIAIWSPARGRRSSDADAAPLDILKRRLARGEITPEAYQQAKDLLERDADKS